MAQSQQGPYWHDSVTQLLQVCRLHIYDTNLNLNPACPFSSDIDKAFPSTQQLLTEYSLVLWSVSVNRLMDRWLCMKMSVDQQLLRHSEQTVWHEQPCHVQSHLHPFLSNSDAWLELQQVYMPKCTKLLPADWLISYLRTSNNRTGVPNKVLSVYEACEEYKCIKWA